MIPSVWQVWWDDRTAVVEDTFYVYPQFPWENGKIEFLAELGGKGARVLLKINGRTVCDASSFPSPCKQDIYHCDMIEVTVIPDVRIGPFAIATRFQRSENQDLRPCEGRPIS